MRGEVIAVSWTMPPIVAPRSVQVARTLEGLRLLGWRSTVVTQSPRDHGTANQDDSLQRLFSNSYGRSDVQLHGATFAELLGEPSTWSVHRLSVRAQHRFFQAVNLLFLVPYLCMILPRSWIHHPTWYWTSPGWLEVKWRDRAVRKARALLESSSNPLLLTFGQPWIDHEIGLRIKRRSSVPWVAHFSDPWTDSPFFVEGHASDLDRQLRLEGLTVEQASALVFVTQDTADLVMRKYPAHYRSKVHVIPHSLPADCEDLVPEDSKRGSLTEAAISLLHAGNLYGVRQAFNLIDAVAYLYNSGQLPTGFRLRLVGSCDRRDELMRHIGDAGIPDDMISLGEPVGWLESRSEMEHARALVLIEAPIPSSPFLPSKLLDYLAANRPILGLTPEGSPSAKLLRQLGYPTAEPSDPQDIASAILEVLDAAGDSHGAHRTGKRAILGQYSNAKIAAEWDRLLSSLSP